MCRQQGLPRGAAQTHEAPDSGSTKRRQNRDRYGSRGNVCGYLARFFGVAVMTADRFSCLALCYR